MLRLNTSIRTALCQAVITAAGANAIGELWNGAVPASLGAGGAPQSSQSASAA